MKISKNPFFFKLALVSLSLLIFALPLFPVQAVAVPTLILSPASMGGIAQITVYGEPNSSVELHYGNLASSVNVVGTTNQTGALVTPISIGSYNVTCGSSAYVIVAGQQSATIPWSYSGTSCGSLLFNPAGFNLSVGQSTTTMAISSVNLSLSTNSNPTIASATVSGNQVTVTGLGLGTTNLIICAADSPNLCGTVPVTVGTNSAISFSQTNVALGLGQTQTVAIYGSGNYSISSNSSPANVPVGLNGNTLSFYGAALGGSTATVCQQSGGACGTIYASVTNGSQPIVTQALGLSSLSVSMANTTGNIPGVGSIVTVNFTANQPIVNPSVTIGTTRVIATGSNVGPYSANYTLTGIEGTAFPISVAFADLAGNAGGVSFSFSNNIAAPALTPAPVPIPVPAPVVTPSPEPVISETVSGFLNLGSKGTEVLKLQRLLKGKGFYSGPVTGYFGPLTEKAVKGFQKANKIKVAGYVGPATREALNK